ncbi:hypothetical protein PG2072B_0660 [Bifidobacterium pseudolongum subsp. globosum]|uniref:Uncharacterized protein n=1 Tax=Bifidobacterium pseudolongum subsp. globosum TaxID=1690 RepID=A0A4Q5BFC0_9BIFI|nr:hypothetical protein [Bifidobacterium pseudolongum]RYQ50270.1 hypothetical protein PG1770B_0747 [Bifidobacterium pseudolongum subsp. globosum]RYQ68866.1 hypothetical protein PG2072B_0660 [Bifidobacterium pseudolongum subsp. globosum]
MKRYVPRATGIEKLVKGLTSEFVEDPLFSMFRIMWLSEMPFAERLPYTQKLIGYIDQNVATEEGFSCLDGLKEIVPCYNAMLLEAYGRLSLTESRQAQAALRWIKQYRLWGRGQGTPWPHVGIRGHGGCLDAIPCCIGSWMKATGVPTADGRSGWIACMNAAGVAGCLCSIGDCGFSHVKVPGWGWCGNVGRRCRCS